MKRLVIFSMILVSSIFADDAEPLPVVPPAPKTEGPHHYQVGLDAFWQHSYGANENYIQEFNGYFVGPRVIYEYFQPDSIYFGIEGVTAGGSSKVAFIFNNKETLKREDMSSLYANIEGRVGYAFQQNSLDVIHYAGLGWNYQHGDAAQDWFVDYLYATGGARLNQKVSKHFDVGFNANLTYAFYAQRHINKRIFKMKERFWGYGISIPLTWHTNEIQTLDIRLEPYFQSLDARMHFFNLGSRLDLVFRF